MVPTTWTVSEEEIRETTLRGGGLVQSAKIGSFSIAEIRLPGGATIVMVPFGIATSGEGCKELVSRLARTGNGEINGLSTTGKMAMLEDNLESFSSSDSQVEESKNDEARLPNFPSLSVRLLEEGGKRRKFPLNSREPIDFETDLFKGKILVIVRPPHPEKDDPYWNERIFSEKKRRVIIQLQGKFKYKPQGVLYAGAEISEQMQLGLVTSGLSKMLLKVMGGFFNNLHYSFGDKEGNEIPHIVAPAYTFFNKLVATPPGETPPHMDTPFTESPESLKEREKTKSFGEWNTEDTYSFSFYSMYVDLPTWQLVGLPASGDLSLKTFWRNSLLMLCMYEKTGTSKKHLRKSNRYAFSVQIKFLGKHGQRAEDGDDESSSDEEENNVISWSDRRRNSIGHIPKSPSNDRIYRSESQVFLEVSEQADEKDQFFFDAIEGGDSDDEERDPRPNAVASPPRTFPSTSIQLLASIDAVVPAWLDVIASGKGGGYIKAFAVNVGSATVFRTQQICEEVIQGAKDKIEQTIREYFSPRLSSSEKLRRSLGLALSRPPEQTGVSPERVSSFWGQRSDKDITFLRHKKPSLSDKEQSTIRASGFVARAISDRHWVEEWAQINNRTISFHHPEKRKAQFRLLISNITKAEKLDPDLCPCFAGCCVLSLTTVGRTVYLLFASEAELNIWLRMTVDSQQQTFLDDTSSQSSNDTNSTRFVGIFENPADDFLHKSSMWHCKNRRILNCGRFFFRQQAETVVEDDPLVLAEDALRKALGSPADGFEDFGQRRVFLDSAAKLKQAFVLGLSENARLAFFLNVYHTMISHAYLVLGPPDSSLKWITYFNNVAYEVGDDIFSLAELEHCIIRAKMSHPTQFFSRFIIPKSTYQVALGKADYRINFALNCGSLSNPSTITVYQADRLQDQLNAACRLYLRCVTYRRTNSGNLELKVPKICQWYTEDFGSSRQNLLKKIERYLSDDVRRQLAGCWFSVERKFDMSSCDVVYQSYNFECRRLSL